LELIGWPSVRIVIGGISIFIFLPVLRVIVMLIIFVCERDYRFGAIATLVLMIIVLGAALGVHMADGMPGFHPSRVAARQDEPQLHGLRPLRRSSPEPQAKM
jgi:hypothetical protein